MTYTNFLGRGVDAVCITDAFDFAKDDGEILISRNVFKTAI